MPLISPPKKQRMAMRGDIRADPIILRGAGGEVFRKELQHDVPLPTIIKFKTKKVEE